MKRIRKNAWATKPWSLAACATARPHYSFAAASRAAVHFAAASRAAVHFAAASRAAVHFAAASRAGRSFSATSRDQMRCRFAIVPVAGVFRPAFDKSLNHPIFSAEKESGADASVLDDHKLSEPGKFAVLYHNDDFTTMEFVIETLMKFFSKTEEQATKIMIEVHTQKKAVAGIFTFEIAETKVMQVLAYAKARGFPLQLTTEAL